MILKRVFPLLALILLAFSGAVIANEQHDAHHTTEQHAAGGHEEDEGGFNASEVIFGHVSDSHYWHLFDWQGHPVSLSLPVIIYNTEKGLDVFSASHFEHGHVPYNGYEIVKGRTEKIVATDGTQIYDFSITKNVLSMLISVVLLLWIMLGVANKYKKNGVMTAPSGMQNAIEPVITFMRDEVAKPNLGSKYMKYMPLILTVFFFIWINNLLGLLPGGANLTGNVAVTACLSIISFIVMLVSGNKHFWGHIFNPPGVPLGVKMLLVPIEIISLFVKPIALTIRLFANILAGHILILSLISLIFILGSAVGTFWGWFVSPISLAFSIFMFMLELLVAAIQAFIFANLTAVFIGQAIEDTHHEHHDEETYSVSENEIIA